MRGHRKLVLTILFCTGAAIAGGFMIYCASGFSEIRDAIETTLKYQLSGIGAYQGSNVLSKFSFKGDPSNTDGQ